MHRLVSAISSTWDRIVLFAKRLISHSRPIPYPDRPAIGELNGLDVLVADTEVHSANAAVPCREETPSPRAHRRRIVDAQSMKTPSKENEFSTLSELLDAIDDTLDSLSINDKEFLAFSERSTIKGLRKLGPTIIPRRSIDDTKPSTYKVSPDAPRPALLFLAINRGSSVPEVGDFMAPDFFFACKERSVPPFVTKTTGDIYQVGFGWRDTKDGRQSWAGFYVGVSRTDGEINVTSYLSRKSVTLTKGKNKNCSYSQSKWVVSSWHWDWSRQKAEEAVRYCVADMFNRLCEVDQSWTVTIEKNGRRMRAMIPTKRTAYFFKNRDRTALTAAGKRRPVAHFVKTHERNIGNGKVIDIREHVRGLRQFKWEGADININHPKFHILPSIEYATAAESSIELARSGAGRALTVLDVANVLCDMERTQGAVPIPSGRDIAELSNETVDAMEEQ